MASNGTNTMIVDVTENKCFEEKPEKNTLAVWISAKWKPILAEFIATMTLVFFGCMSCIPINGVRPSPLSISLGFGLTVMFNVQIFGHVSGALMNPAVTLASVIFGSNSVVLGICFATAQFTGALLGYGILMGVAPMDIASHGICVPMPHPDLDPFQALAIEIIVSATWVSICCSLGDPVHKHNQDSGALKFGLAIVGLSAAAGSQTGAITNPARTFAPALWSGVWNLHWVYWAGPFLGATLAATFYRAVLLKVRKD